MKNATQRITAILEEHNAIYELASWQARTPHWRAQIVTSYMQGGSNDVPSRVQDHVQYIRNNITGNVSEWPDHSGDLLKIGGGATLNYWSDRKPATIIAVSPNGKKVTVQEDDAKRIDKNGMSEDQEYEYSPNTDGGVFVFSLRKNGQFVRVGSKIGQGLTMSFGRRKYYDYSF
jgi:hypothetical protein